jgi:hypothetical protein
LLLSVIEMGREKRKGKEIVVEEPARKRTRAAREAERAEMVAKAAEEQASGRARPFAIRDTPARGRGRGMGRVRGARATRATTAAAAAESDQSHSAAESDSDTEGEQSEQSRDRAHSHRLYDVLAAPDRGREEVTSLRSLAGPQQQLVEPRP